MNSLIDQEGANHTDRVFLREECQSICPGSQIKALVIRSLVGDLTTGLFRF